MVKVIGLTGSIGAGKGVVSEILEEEYDYVKLTVGDLIREFVKHKGLEVTRDNCDEWAEKMLEEKGEDYWLKQIVSKIREEGYEKVVVDGVRSPSNDEVLREALGEGYVLFKVDADANVRFERLKKRGRPGFPETLEEFKEHESRQNKMFNLGETFERAEEVVDNSTSIGDLKQRVKSTMSGYPDWV